ncbi:class I SAM-dependent methyltransferase [Neobacillus mesonae]|uniref:class I SAM-dependent methyltransferase n=1 Tax=Neobacillus mesonae TaxID=1193713 RepID=UPI00203FF886|nr:class I SAM-dependent methyltransferase [Neobacillus mesonae]MCM3567426.1 class I SAM-dependent methyltransferase [Neobacillus mesonae]
MNNHWTKMIYRLWSPVYDYFFNRGPFLNARRKVFNGVCFKKGEKVLFVGVGTGADLEWVPVNHLKITAIDYSEEMLLQAKRKFQTGTINFRQMDAQDLQLADNSFDYVIASLILSVVPDSSKVFSEMIRVTRSGGRIIIFDKFASKPLRVKKLIRPIIKILGTDIGLSFETLFAKHRDHTITLLEDQAVLFGGMYRKIMIGKK